MSVVGFDIGNAFSKIAVTKNKNIAMVPNDLSQLLTPTLVSFLENERQFGDQALLTWARNPKNTIYGIKRLLGRKIDDPKFQTESKNWCFFPVEMLNETNRLIGVKVKSSQLSDTNLLAPEQILGGYLSKLKEFTSKYMDNMIIKDCVIACPSYFDDAQRRAIITAARLAELNVLRLVNEPTAIALQYGILRPLPKDSTRRVIFVDVGESSTEVAVVDFIQGKLSVKCTTFNPDFGGRNFDLNLYHHFSKQFKSKHHIDIEDYPRSKLRLLRECSTIKKLLSANKDAVVTLECLVEEHDLQLKITREEFSSLNEDNIKQCILPLQEALDKIKNDNVEIHSVEIVGGASRIPTLQDAILNTVSKVDNKIEKLMTTLNGDEACARGAALMCAMLSPNFKVKEFQVQDINTWPVTLLYKNEKQEDIVDLILKTGHPQPCNAKITFQKQTSFDFTLTYPTNFNIDEKTEVHIDYPVTTEKTIGTFRCQIPDLSPQLVADPKVKLTVNLNKHSLIEWPEAIFIEYVKKEEKKEIKKPPEATQINNDTNLQNLAANKSDTNDPQPMEVDNQEQNSNKDANKANDGSQPMETDTANNSKDEKKNDNDKKKDDEKKDDEKKNDEKKDDEKKDDEKKEKRDKRKITRTLVVTGKLNNEITNDLFNKWHELECQLANIDRVIRETSEKRNELETYVYALRDKLESIYRDFVVKEDCEKYLNKLDEIQDWLYGEGEHAQKSFYIEKLKELRVIGDPIASRYWESQHRASRIETFKKLIGRYSNFCDTQDEQFSHIGADEKDKVRKQVSDADNWLFENLQKQDKLPNSQDPAFTCAQIDNKYRDLMNFCESIMNKPKPKPKPQEPPANTNANTPNDGSNANANAGANANANVDANANANANVDANANANVNANADNQQNNQPQQQQQQPSEAQNSSNVNADNNNNNNNEPTQEQKTEKNDPMEIS